MIVNKITEEEMFLMSKLNKNFTQLPNNIWCCQKYN